jgi:short-subunit dehydrogenase involved in D-alanine esterification of teichoic acids
MKLRGNKLIITGATRGIGLALTDALYQQDNKIIAVARNTARLEQLKQKYPKIDIITCDLVNQKSIDAFITEISSHHSDANILINNAGIQVNLYDSIYGQEPEKLSLLKDEIQINFTAVVELTFRLIPLLIQNANASIVNVSSGLAFVPKKSAPVYCGTKAAVHIFTKSLRYQYEDSHLKVFEIIPPLVDTDMTKGRGKDKLTPEALVKQFMKAYQADRYEINIGKTKLLRIIQRIFPSLADKILKNN